MRKCPACDTFLSPGVRVCPECGKRPGGPGKPAHASGVSPEEAQRRYEAIRMASVARAQAQAEKWLGARGLMPMPGESTPAYLSRLAEFRRKLASTPRPHPRQWARDILQADEDGETLPVISLRLAKEVAGKGFEDVA